MVCDSCCHRSSCRSICSLRDISCNKWKPSIKSIREYKSLKQNDIIYITLVNTYAKKISIYECKIIVADKMDNPKKFNIAVDGRLGKLNLTEIQLGFLNTDLTTAIINNTSNNTEFVDINGTSHKINYKGLNEYDM